MFVNLVSRIAIAVAVVQAGAVGITAAMAPPAQAQPASRAPMSSATLISLVVNGVPAAGIPAYAGTYGHVASGPGGGLDSGTSFPDPDGVLGFVSAATHTAQAQGTPPIPTWYARGDLVHVDGPSLVTGGTKLVNIPELHNFTQCTPPHALMTDSHVTPQVLALGHVLAVGGPVVTASASGASLGLPAVQSAVLTFQMTTIEHEAGVVSAAVKTQITIAGTLTGPDGAVIYAGPLATYTLADLTADCEAGPAPADVSVTKSGPAIANPDGTVTYTLDVVNNGPGAAADVTIQDPLSAGLTSITGLSSGCAVTGSASKTLACELGTLPDGAVRHVSFTATVTPGAADDSVIGNCGTVYTTTEETTTANNQSCVTTTIEVPPPGPVTDVAIAKAGPATATAGGTVTYTLTASNPASTDAAGVVVSDPLPAGLTLISAPGCTAAGQVLTCAVGALAGGASRSFTITAAVAAGTAAGTVLSNCAEVTTSTEETRTDNNAACQPATVGTPPPPPPAGLPNLAVAKTGPGEVQPGGTAVYTLTVTNNSDVAADNVEVTDAVGGDAGAILAQAPCQVASSVVTCQLGTLAPGETRVISIRVSVPPGAPAGGTVENCGEALTTTAESGYGDNRSCSATVIDPAPPPPAARVTIAKSGPASVKPGGSISYTLTVTSHGPGAASQVVVSDVLDDQIVKVTSVPAGCALAARTVTCHAGTLPAHASRAYTISGTVTADAGAGGVGGVVEDCASVYAATPGALMTRTEDAVLAACVSTGLEHRVIPEGPAGTGGGLAPAGGAGPAGSLAAAGWALLATGLLLPIAYAGRRRRALG
jgi:uncharacterized repeat protein (TIGR01451 family)